MTAPFRMGVNVMRSIDVSQFPSGLFELFDDFFAVHSMCIIHTIHMFQSTHL